jgi:hypothetical protein
VDSSLRRADALVDAGRLSSGLAYPAVVVVTIGLGVWVIAPALYPVPGKADWWTVESDLYLAGSSFVWHALGMTVYVQQRFSRRAQARLLALQATAAERERQLAAAQLLTLQARVDPALLSDRLARIDAELQTQPLQAQARLAALSTCCGRCSPTWRPRCPRWRARSPRCGPTPPWSAPAASTPGACTSLAWTSRPTGCWRPRCCCPWCDRCWTTTAASGA